MSSKAPSAPRFKPATFQPFDASTLQTTSPRSANQLVSDYDRQYYAASDADYARRHPDIVAANKAAERNINDQVQGNVPAGLVGALTRAGLADGSAALQDTTIPGSEGSYGLSRKLGQDYGQYQQQALQNLAALNAANPQRSFGLTGGNALNLELNNQNLVNSANIGNFQGQNEVAIANATGMNSAAQGGFAGALQAAAQQRAQQTALVNAGIGLASTAAGAYFGGGGGGGGASSAGLTSGANGVGFGVGAG